MHFGAGIRAVLTGGACANLYSGGVYQSSDADFVLAGHCSTNDVDRALSTLGFAREGDRYVHRFISFFVEFPSGPLGIGRDLRIRPVWRSRRAAKTLALSATDACRDRLKIRAWSRSEGHAEGYIVFLAELRRRRAAYRPRKKHA